jgi:glycosyltransferase involved in cell wall biosynthesis
MKLSLVFGFKNRDGERVRRCLDSLANQELDQFEVIFVDYGSERSCRAEIEPLVRSYRFARYVYCETRGWPWNRAHALNVGIRLSQAELVMTSDIDLIFSDFSLKKMIDGYDGKTALHAGCYYLPQDFNRWDSLSANRSRYARPRTSALGLLLLLPRNVYLRLGGFDEFYQFWGREDSDLEGRLNGICFETRFLNIDEFPLYHQWHPIQNNTTVAFMPEIYWMRAQFHFGQYAHISKRNEPDGMGRLVEKKERPSLEFLDNEREPQKTLREERDLEIALARQFMSLKDGECVEMESDWVAPNPFWEKLAVRLNYHLGKNGVGFHVDYKRNMAKEVFWSFLGTYRELVRDFAYSSDERRFYLVRKG